MKTGMIDRIHGRGEKKLSLGKNFGFWGMGKFGETVISGTIAVLWKESWPDQREF